MTHAATFELAEAPHVEKDRDCNNDHDTIETRNACTFKA